MELMNDDDLKSSKKFLNELLEHEATVLNDLQVQNISIEHQDLILDPLRSFRMGVEQDIREYEQKRKNK